MSDFKPDFSPSESQVELNKISRPSLSYWEDAFIRFRKNKRAVASFFIIVFMALFVSIGPVIYDVDFKQTNVKSISKGFADQRLVEVVGDIELYDEKVLENVEAHPPVPQNLGKSSALSLSTEATLQSVNIEWQAVPGASGYEIFRNEYKPRDIHALGLPLGEVDAGNIVSYQDFLRLEAIDYYYSVVAVNGELRSSEYTTLVVKPKETMSLDEAQKIQKDAKVGDVLKLEFSLLGTDKLGRDILSRLMRGGRVSLFIGILAPILSIMIGVLYGGISGYVGGALDNAMMRFCDFIISLPFLLFVILIKVALTAGDVKKGWLAFIDEEYLSIAAIMIALVALGWPGTARLVRGQILQIREEAYVQAAQLLGANRLYLILRHMIPNTMGVILVSLSFAVPGAIFSEAFLSFLGMGVAAPETSWGAMCEGGVKSILTYPHELISPAIFISITVLAFNTLGDGLRDALDSKLRSRE